MKTLVLFDVDGTLTESRKIIKQDMIDMLHKLKVDIGIVGGSNLVKQKEQLLEENLNIFNYVFSENGLVAFKDNQLIHEMDILNHLGEDNIKKLINTSLKYMSELDIPKKRGTFIEFRKGMINLCPVGRSCSQEERDEFFDYDSKHNIRINMVKYLSDELKELNLKFSIGGQISIDVFPIGWDKTYCLQHIENEKYERILFFGDRTMEGGNDYEIYNHTLTEAYTVNDPSDTIKKLNELFF
jgi:phosphomannomutase